MVRSDFTATPALVTITEAECMQIRRFVDATVKRLCSSSSPFLPQNLLTSEAYREFFDDALNSSLNVYKRLEAMRMVYDEILMSVSSACLHPLLAGAEIYIQPQTPSALKQNYIRQMLVSKLVDKAPPAFNPAVSATILNPKIELSAYVRRHAAFVQTAISYLVYDSDLN